jgi:hypothetical protein
MFLRFQGIQEQPKIVPETSKREKAVGMGGERLRPGNSRVEQSGGGTLEIVKNRIE